jgi:hypothetical protein
LSSSLQKRKKKKIGNNDNEAESKEADPPINSTKKDIKRKIILQKTTKNVNSSVTLFSQKTRKLNPLPNQVNTIKGLEGNQESTDKEESTTQDEKVVKSETMQPIEISSLTKIPIKNRFDILQ